VGWKSGADIDVTVRMFGFVIPSAFVIWTLYYFGPGSPNKW
jgi:hypothetical protein